MIVHADPEIIKQIAEDIKGPRRPRGAGHERAEQAEFGGPGGAEMQIGNKQYGHGSGPPRERPPGRVNAAKGAV